MGRLFWGIGLVQMKKRNYEGGKNSENFSKGMKNMKSFLGLSLQPVPSNTKKHARTGYQI